MAGNKNTATLLSTDYNESNHSQQNCTIESNQQQIENSTDVIMMGAARAATRFKVGCSGVSICQTFFATFIKQTRFSLLPLLASQKILLMSATLSSWRSYLAFVNKVFCLPRLLLCVVLVMVLVLLLVLLLLLLAFVVFEFLLFFFFS